MGDIIEPMLPGAIGDRYPLTVGVRRTATAPADAVRGRVLTLSNGGATISLDTKVTTRERVWLAFEQASAGVDFATAGAVTSVECSQAGHWNASVAFDDQLTTSELAPLQAALGEADPQNLRPIMGEAVADWGPGISPTIVQLRSISTGGFCMVSKQAETVDARFHLTIETVADNRFVIPARGAIAAQDRRRVRDHLRISLQPGLSPDGRGLSGERPAAPGGSTHSPPSRWR